MKLVGGNTQMPCAAHRSYRTAVAWSDEWRNVSDRYDDWIAR
jgi:hypothetical protein